MLKARENLAGKITVTEGRLSHFPLEPRTLHDPSPPIVHFPASCRQDWMPGPLHVRWLTHAELASAGTWTLFGRAAPAAFSIVGPGKLCNPGFKYF